MEQTTAGALSCRLGEGSGGGCGTRRGRTVGVVLELLELFGPEFALGLAHGGGEEGGAVRWDSGQQNKNII